MAATLSDSPHKNGCNIADNKNNPLTKKKQKKTKNQKQKTKRMRRGVIKADKSRGGREGVLILIRKTNNYWHQYRVFKVYSSNCGDC